MTTSPDDADFAKQIGARLHQARTESDAGTQTEVAKKLGLGTNSVGIWERGGAIPLATNLAALCRLYRVSADWVLGLTETPTLRGSGGIVNLAVERAVLQASSWRELEKTASALGAMKPPGILFGYAVPQEFEALCEAEWKSRRDALELKLRRLSHEHGATPPGGGKRRV